MEIVLALICMVCKGIDDFLHKLVACRDDGKNIYAFYLIQLLVIMIIMCLLWSTNLIKIYCNLEIILYSISLGILSFVTYFLLLKGLVNSDGASGVIIFRLNFIVTGIIAFTLLGESITIGKLAGTALCIFSIVLLNTKNIKNNKIDKSILYCILACISAGLLNVLNKAAVNNTMQVYSLLFFRYMAALIIALFLWGNKELMVYINKAKNKQINKKHLAISIISGVINLFCMILLYIALTIGDVTIVSPIIQLSFVFTSILCLIYFKEKMGTKKILALVSAVLCIALMTI